MLPHLPVVGDGKSRNPGPAERGRRLSGKHSGGGGRPIGEEIGMPSPPQGPPAARSDGLRNSDRGREEQEDARASPHNTWLRSVLGLAELEFKPSRLSTEPSSLTSGHQGTLRLHNNFFLYTYIPNLGHMWRLFPTLWDTIRVAAHTLRTSRSSSVRRPPPLVFSTTRNLGSLDSYIGRQTFNPT